MAAAQAQRRSRAVLESHRYRQLAPDFPVRRRRQYSQPCRSARLSLKGPSMTMKTPPHPGDLIRTEVIEALGLSVTQAAEMLGVRRATLSDLLNEKAALSPE